MTQADIARTVKALVRTLTAAGLTVTGTKVSFLRGEPVIEVLTSGESTPPVQREASHKDDGRGCGRAIACGLSGAADAASAWGGREKMIEASDD